MTDTECFLFPLLVILAIILVARLMFRSHRRSQDIHEIVSWKDE